MFQLCFSSKIKNPYNHMIIRVFALIKSTRSGTWTRTAVKPKDFKSFVSTIPPSGPDIDQKERKTGLGPATPTLARSCSTNWAIFAFYFLMITIFFALSLPRSERVWTLGQGRALPTELFSQKNLIAPDSLFMNRGSLFSQSGCKDTFFF